MALKYAINLERTVYLLSFAAGETQMIIMQTHQKVAHTSRLADPEGSPG